MMLALFTGANAGSSLKASLQVGVICRNIRVETTGRSNCSLTVRRCFLRMYMMKPHILDVTPRKVRMPSKHCRVFSMLTSTQRPHSSSALPQLTARVARSCRGIITEGTWLLVSQNPSLATAAKLALQFNKRPSKRVSTSLCTLAAQLVSNRVDSHCNRDRKTW